MSSKIQLCNRSLMRIGAETINSITENSASAIACNLFFDDLARELMSEHPWHFAKKQVALVIDTTVTLPTEWLYAYSSPSDMLRLRGIEAQAYAVAEPHYHKDGLIYSDAIVAGASPRHELRGETIFANTADAVAVYTGDITDTEKWSVGFTRAFIERLSAELVMPIKDDERRYRALISSAEAQANKAKAQDVAQQDNRINRISNTMQSRR